MGSRETGRAEKEVVICNDTDVSDQLLNAINHAAEGTTATTAVAEGPGGEVEVGDGRETWGKKIDFLLSVIGFAVDLANVWRFPYLCYKNGGGAFLVPYSIMLIFGGIPLFFMELALGQYQRKGAISAWGSVCPLLKGIGWAVVLIAFFTDFFYNVIISWALYYFVASFNPVLPWTECGDWSTDACFSGHLTNNEKFPTCVYKERQDICKQFASVNFFNSDCSNCTISNFSLPTVGRSEAMMSSFRSQVDWLFNASSYNLYDSDSDSFKLTVDMMPEYCGWQPNSTSPAAEYFNRGVLGLHKSTSINDIGGIRWQNALCLLAIYLICYFSLWKGISTSGKVVWFTALFPYVVLFILLVRGVTLPGAGEGIKEYITPKFSEILRASVWVDAATQVFFSLGPGFGVLLAFSSYNKFNNNVYRDAILTSLINCATSLLAGFVVFSILGYLSFKTCKEFYKVATEGPGLVFEIYPEAIATLPGAHVWSVLFFLMLITLGLDSSFGGSEAIITGIGDEFSILKRRREIFVAVLFLVYFFIGLASCTDGGYYVVRIFETFAAGYSILFAVFCESCVVSWIYGVWRFSSDIKCMIGEPPGLFWVACWTLIAPIFLATIMVYGLAQYTPLSIGSDPYPTWAIIFGWTMAGSSMACIPLFAVVMVIKHKTDSVKLLNAWWLSSDSYFSHVSKDYFLLRWLPYKQQKQTPAAVYDEDAAAEMETCLGAGGDNGSAPTVHTCEP